MSIESAGIDPYEAALADLRKKRDHIDSLIAAIENIRASGGTMSVGAALAVPGGATPSSDGPGAYLGMSIVDATKRFLAAKRQPHKVADILAGLRAGGLVLTSKEPANVIGSVLTRHFYDVGDIVRVERGLWGLKEWYPGRSFKKDKADNGEKVEAVPEAKEPEKKSMLAGLPGTRSASGLSIRKRSP